MVILNILSEENSKTWASYLEWPAAIHPKGVVAGWSNRAIICFITLFALTVPHSIAASQISFGLGLIAWAVRDIAMRRLNFKRTAFDLPLICFLGLTILSSIFSIEPTVSLTKLKVLTLFLMAHFVATNLNSRGSRLMIAVVMISALTGLGFSLCEKLTGRGMVISSIAPDSPLVQSGLQTGDVVWMIAKKRVYSPGQVAEVINSHNIGEVLSVEALHDGDPVPVSIEVTEDLKANPNPLGITSSGRSRKFRISGFGRQFLTFAEQMQILALIAFGSLLILIGRPGQNSIRTLIRVSGLLFICFSLGLVLTASRAIIASFIMTVILVSIAVKTRLAPAIALLAVLTFGGLGYLALSTTRHQSTANFSDDSSSRRIAYIKAGLRMIPKHPLLGVGMDSHKLHWKEWGFPGDYITHTHSTAVQIAMDRGLPALACYFWLIATIILARWRRHKTLLAKDDIIGAGLTLGVCLAVSGFFISSFFNYNFGDSEILMILLGLVGMTEMDECSDGQGQTSR